MIKSEILKSPAGQRMLRNISPIYDNAYVMLWLNEVMGREWDEGELLLNNLRDQITPETADWGLYYYQQQFGLKPEPQLLKLRPDQQKSEAEERLVETARRSVIIKKNTRSPMNPARIKKIAEEAGRWPVEVYEGTDPYTFDIAVMPGTETLELDEAVKAVRKAKPSHISFKFYVLLKDRICLKERISMYVLSRHTKLGFSWKLGTTPFTTAGPEVIVK